MLVRHFAQCGGDSLRTLAHRVLRPAALVLALAREHAGFEDAPGGDAEPASRSHRQQLAFGIARRHAVRKLHCDERAPAAKVGDRIRPADHPRWSVREPDVEHLPEPHLIVERTHDFLDRRQRVPHVQPQDVDIVGPQTAQALLQ